MTEDGERPGHHLLLFSREVPLYTDKAHICMLTSRTPGLGS